MDVKDAITERRSIRAFDSRPVSKDIMKEVMERALWAPSWGNTQPWAFTIVSGLPMESIRKECIQLSLKGEKPTPEVEPPAKWGGAETSRYKGLGAGLFNALGIQREDKEKRNAYYQNMFECFGAPHVIYLHFEKGFHPYALMDGGLIFQTIALLAVERGLGTCLLAASVIYPGIIRKYARIPENRTLVLGIAIGYPLPDHPANLFRSQRGKPEEFLQWIE